MSRLAELQRELEDIRKEKRVEAKEREEQIPEYEPEFAEEDVFEEMITAFKKQNDGNYRIQLKHISWDRLCYVLEGLFLEEPPTSPSIHLTKPRSSGKRQIAELLDDYGLPAHCIKYITAHKNNLFSVKISDVPFSRTVIVMKNVFFGDLSGFGSDSPNIPSPDLDDNAQFS